MGTREMLFDNWPYMKGWEETIGGNRFTGIETGSAVGVIPIRRLQDTTIEITLIEEKRIETAGTIVKEVGTFLRGRDHETVAHEALRAEAGISAAQLHLLVPRMEGFTVITLPIATYIAINWSIVGDGSAKRRTMSLNDAIEMVLAQRGGDQTTTDAIMRIALLETRGKLLPF